MYLDYDKKDALINERQIPQSVKDMVEAIASKVGCDIEWTEVRLHNRGGFVYAWGQGIELIHCTSSMLDGPTTDYSNEMQRWLKGLDFEIENSVGDNGMDAETNWHDTYWMTQLVYKPSIVYKDEFIVWEESDYEE